MEEQFRLLAEVQDIDSKIEHLRKRIMRKPKKIEKLEAEYDTYEKQIQDKRLKIDEIEKERSGCELDLKEGETRVAKSRETLMNIKSNKEYKAAVKEIAAIEKGNKRLEDEILSCLEAVEQANTVLAETKKELSDRADELKREKTLIEREVQRDQKELGTVMDQRKQMIERIDQDLMRKYNQVQKHIGILALARVENGVCQGCHMNIPPQIYNEIQRLDSARLCPNCQRIMYYKKEE